MINNVCNIINYKTKQPQSMSLCLLFVDCVNVIKCADAVFCDISSTIYSVIGNKSQH